MRRGGVSNFRCQGDGASPRTPKGGRLRRGGGLRRGWGRGCLLGGTGARMRPHWTGSACTFTTTFTLALTCTLTFTYTLTYTLAYI